MSAILVSLFYLWLLGSIVVLVRRRLVRPSKAEPIVVVETAEEAVTRFEADLPPTPAPAGAVATALASASLAEAVTGIAMPCDLGPLGDMTDPSYVAFSTAELDHQTIKTALVDEFERIGFTVASQGECSLHATKGVDMVEIKLWSQLLNSPAVMAEEFPNAAAESLVAELRLR